MIDLARTIVAIATPPGRGGLGCLRISGPDAFSISGELFRCDRPTEEIGRARFGTFVTEEEVVLDHGYRILFAEGASYTGEPTAELWTHGSPPVLEALVAAAIARGAEPATPGEFTYRALCHGRLDLARAEAIRDLIEARTTFQARVAFRQVEGELSRTLAPLVAELENWIARVEAGVEFVDEEETHLPRGAMTGALDGLAERCRELLEQFETGRVVRDGASLAIVGRPNAGKSTLFNRLLGRERAIVTEEAGTTRDTLEESIDLGGIPLRLIDTAGLRDAVDRAEHEGVRRARSAEREADVVLHVLDGSEDEEAGVERDGTRTITVLNKADLPRAREAKAGELSVSAKTGAGMDRLRSRLREKLVGKGELEPPLLTRRRHAAALGRAREVLERAIENVRRGFTEDLVLEDLKEARREIGSITGEFSNEQLYDRIFSEFCIGK